MRQQVWAHAVVIRCKPGRYAVEFLQHCSVVQVGVISVQSTSNNTIITLADTQGRAQVGRHSCPLTSVPVQRKEGFLWVQTTT